MVYQSLDSVGTVNSHGAQVKHLFVKDWYCPNVLQTHEQTQYQPLRHLVVEMQGW